MAFVFGKEGSILRITARAKKKKRHPLLVLDKVSILLSSIPTGLRNKA